MTLPLAALYDISLGFHQVAGLGLILLAVILTVISTLARSDEPLLEKGLKIKPAAYPLFTIVVITGIYQLAHLHEKLLQTWVIGAALLGIGYMGALDGTWVPLARRILSGELEGDELKKTKIKTIAVGAGMIIMIIAATGMMESQTG
jgi:hypothetical protein